MYLWIHLSTQEATQINKSLFRYATVLLADNADASNPDADFMITFFMMNQKYALVLYLIVC